MLYVAWPLSAVYYRVLMFLLCLPYWLHPRYVDTNFPVEIFVCRAWGVDGPFSDHKSSTKNTLQSLTLLPKGGSLLQWLVVPSLELYLLHGQVIGSAAAIQWRLHALFSSAAL